MGTVGPTQFVVLVNGRIRSFNKAGLNAGLADGVLDTTANSFFNSVRAGTNASDPRIRYDRLSARWIMVIINTPSNQNSILIAVSDAASAGTITQCTGGADCIPPGVCTGLMCTGGTVFTFFSIPVVSTTPAISNSCFGDYPTLGVDNNALYIGTNNFCTSYNSSDGFVVQKSSVLEAGPYVVTVFRGLVPSSSTDGPYTPQGVDNYDAAANEGYFIGVSRTTLGRLVLRRVSNPGGPLISPPTPAPGISSNILITVNATASPINVPALGSTRLLDALTARARLFAAHIRNGKLWTAHNIRVNSSGVGSVTGDRDGSRWYELQGILSPGTPSVVQSGTVFDSAATDPRYYWIPSIMVSGQGHAAMGYSTAGSLFRADAGTVGRLVGDTLGTMQTPINNYNIASTTAYNLGAENPWRWGDYSYVSLDPLDDMTMWSIQEFCNAIDSWGVQVVQLKAPPPATPATATPAAVEPGNASVTPVTITGTSVSGSGFYDPGPNLASPALAFQHISATVTPVPPTIGSIIVNSVTFVNPTTVTLNLNTTAAGSGTWTVTITNPDGQSRTSSTGILTVGASVSRVLSFGANGYDGGRVLVHWRTGSEVDTLGFNVYREENGRLIRLNPSLIASSVFSPLPGGRVMPGGRFYSWWDAVPQGSYNMRYWLEEIDISGRSIWYNPAVIAQLTPPRRRR